MKFVDTSGASLGINIIALMATFIGNPHQFDRDSVVML
jgi:hypothetical protein